MKWIYRVTFVLVLYAITLVYLIKLVQYQEESTEVTFSTRDCFGEVSEKSVRHTTETEDIIELYEGKQFGPGKY